MAENETAGADSGTAGADSGTAGAAANPAGPEGGPATPPKVWQLVHARRVLSGMRDHIPYVYGFGRWQCHQPTRAVPTTHAARAYGSFDI